MANISTGVLILFCFQSTKSVGQGALKAEFYSGKNFEKYVSSQSMNNIDLYWETESPVSGMDHERCSIRWTGSIKPPASGEYRFSAKVDYGLRLWIDDELVIDDWTLTDWGRLDGRIDLEVDRLYDFKVEYFNAMFGGEIRLMWDLPISEAASNRASNAAIIDSKYFFPTQEKDIVIAEASIITTPKYPVSVKSKKSPKKAIRKTKQKNITQETLAKTSPKINENYNKKLPKAVSKDRITQETIEQFTPKTVQFERAQATILESSEVDLKVLADFLILNSYLTVEIEGHTDLAGDPQKNMELSERRAYAVARYLVTKGVQSSHIVAKGMGGTKPLIISAGKKYHPENRRVSFVINVQ